MGTETTNRRMNGPAQIEAMHNYLHLSIKKIAEEAGLATPQTLYDVRNGKHGISRDVATRLHTRFPELSLTWLLTGEGPMLYSYNEGSGEPETDTGRVPLLPVAAFAGPIRAFSEAICSEACETIASPTRGAELALTISGDSMEPMLHDGTIIFIKRINEAAFLPWGHTMVLDTENGTFVKDVYPGPREDTIVARSKNPKYPEMVIPKSSIYGVYRVLNAVKSFAVM